MMVMGFSRLATLFSCSLGEWKVEKDFCNGAYTILSSRAAPSLPNAAETRRWYYLWVAPDRKVSESRRRSHASCWLFVSLLLDLSSHRIHGELRKNVSSKHRTAKFRLAACSTRGKHSLIPRYSRYVYMLSTVDVLPHDYLMLYPF